MTLAERLAAKQAEAKTSGTAEIKVTKTTTLKNNSESGSVVC